MTGSWRFSSSSWGSRSNGKSASANCETPARRRCPWRQRSAGWRRLPSFIWDAHMAGVVLGLMTPARSYLSATALGKLVDRVQDFLRGDEDEETPPAAEVR